MADRDLRQGRGGAGRTSLEISLDLEDLGPAVGEEQLGQLLRATFTDARGTTERTVFVPEPPVDEQERVRLAVQYCPTGALSVEP